MKHTYYFDEYYKDVSDLVLRYSKVKNPHIVAVYNQSLPFAVHISNILECPMSVLKIVDGKCSWILNNTENREIRPTDAPLFPKLLCVDTIFDQDVFTAIKQLPEFIHNPDYTFYTLFGHSNDLKVYYTHELIYKEVNFPWQRIKANSDLVL
tara:strand:+ start:525 stop:980 length:456 start_codon:yes stop_codon:yes gene_type:complete